MTSELYSAVKVVEMTPVGARLRCGCEQEHDWQFWPQVLMLADEGYMIGPRSLCGTRDNPGPYAYQTLIWAYCDKCSHFYGGVYKPDRSAKPVYVEVAK